MIGKFLRAIGIYKPVCDLFYKAFHARTSLEVAGIQKTFFSASPELYRRIVNVGGEREQLSVFLNKLVPGDVVWDVGAFIGMFSIFSSERVGNTGRVITFEPEPGTFKLLQENCKLNNADNITLFNAALYDSTDKGMIFASKENENAIHSLRPGEHL
ncbi:MAG: FkbM family methyltransferase [Gammaproteobacteria bacterium]|nr:FkbM family methyltransferase [Gammaproteobacteria bacterium]